MSKLTELGMNKAAEYGLAGIVIFFLFLFLSYIVWTQQKERSEWRTEIVEMSKQQTLALKQLKESMDAFCQKVGRPARK